MSNNNYEIYFENSLLLKSNIDPSTTLDNIRKLIFQKCQKNFYFLTKDSFVRKKMEKKIMLNILCQKNNIIKISNIINFNIIVDNGNKKLKYSTDPSRKLDDLRNVFKKKFPEFYYINKNNNNELIDLCEEMEFQIQDIIINNDIHITTSKKNIITNVKSENIKKSDILQTKKYIKILLNDKFLDILECDMNLKLSDLRHIIEKNSYSTIKFVFLDKNNKRINKNEEPNKTVYDSEIEQKIFLKSVLILNNFQNQLIINFIDENKTEKIKYSSINLLSELRNKYNNIFTCYHRFILKENYEILNKENENSIKIFQVTYNKNYLNVININKNNNFKDIEIYLNNEQIFNKKINVTLNITVIREIINLYKAELIEFCFVDKNNKNILNTEEIKYKIEDILQDNNKLYLVNDKEKENQNFDPLSTSTMSVSLENLPSPPIPKPIEGSKFLCRENNLDIYLYPSLDISKENFNKIYTILMLGETGSGKTSLLNSLTNYLMNIDYSNDFRYKLIVENQSLISPEKSTTKSLNVYNIIFNNILFKVIDTPGYGDTSGPEKDKETTNSIKYYFENVIDGLNLIGFVVKSSENKLTDRQQFIIDNILNLFGNDVVANLMVLMTFYDGSDPQMAKVLPKNKIFKEIIIPVCGKNNWYLTFNNSAMYNKNDSDYFLKNYFELSQKSFGKFLDKLYSLTPVSTLKSKTVLEKRLLLEEKLSKLNEEKEKYKDLLSNKEKQIKDIEQQQKMYDSSKKKIFEFYNINIIKEKLPNNSYNILCKDCYKVCKENVIVKNKLDININNNGLCKKCNCFYKKHEYVDYIIKNIEQQKEEIDIDKLRQEMKLSNEKINNSLLLKSFFEREIYKLRKYFLRIILDIKNILDEINKTALNIDNFETKENYLNSLKKKNPTNYQELYEINQSLKYIKEEKLKNIDDFLKLK